MSRGMAGNSMIGRCAARRLKEMAAGMAMATPCAVAESGLRTLCKVRPCRPWCPSAMTQHSLPLQPESAELPVAWIEIERGRTRHPLRPLAGNRLLIGAGSHCDIQLGGAAIPILHSLIHVEGTELFIEALVASPPLVVGGRLTREGRLQDGDLIEIGTFHLRLRLPAPDDSNLDELNAPLDVETLLAQDEADRAGILLPETAVELVSALEIDVAEASRQESARWAGLAALAGAARAVLPPVPVEEPAALNAAVLRLEQLTVDLASQCRRLEERERALEERSTALLALQEGLLRLVTQLEAGADGGESRLRISA